VVGEVSVQINSSTHQPLQIRYATLHKRLLVNRILILTLIISNEFKWKMMTLQDC